MEVNNTYPDGYEDESYDDQVKRLLKTGRYRECIHCGAFLERLEYCTPRCEMKNDDLVEAAEERDRNYYEA